MIGAADKERFYAEIERQISMWKGTPHGAILESAYRGGASDEGLAKLAGINIEDYGDGSCE